MALQGFLISEFSNGGTIGNLGVVDDAMVAAGVTIASTNNTIVGVGSSHAVHVFGTVGAVGASAIILGDNALVDTGNLVTVVSTGAVSADGAGINLIGSQNVVSNAGTIWGNNYGVQLWSDATTGRSLITNAGSIGAVSTAIYHAGVEALTVINWGQIESQSYALYISDESNTTVTNYGTIIGDLRFENGIDSLTSFGTIQGRVRMGGGTDSVKLLGFGAADVNLGDGADTYDARRAEAAQDIHVYGDDGDDLFIIGHAAEEIDGGAGIDRISLYGLTSGVRVYLDAQGEGAGAALGDTYYGIETVLATAYADLVVASGVANTLYGNGGTDRILAGQGADTVYGGRGIDTITGGGGNDTFIMFNPSEAGDVITDYGNSVGNNDVLHLHAAGFGGGLMAGSLAPSQYRARTDGLAQDANDRFIFNTTTKALWFDANGNAAGGRTMVIDLQPTATFSLADIVLV